VVDRRAAGIILPVTRFWGESIRSCLLNVKIPWGIDLFRLSFEKQKRNLRPGKQSLRYADHNGRKKHTTARLRAVSSCRFPGEWWFKVTKVAGILNVLP
jgi:hypothetical protein